MAKRHRGHTITASFHYLVKMIKESDSEEHQESAFSDAEFQKIIDRISNNAPIDDKDPDIIGRIKAGEEIPFTGYEEVETGLYFGTFEGAYYGQKYRNNIFGEISADSLNLRTFHYLITKLRDGKILVGVTYNGLYGDYDGIRKCLAHLLKGNHSISSRTITSLAHELGNGTPTELRLTYRNASARPEQRGLFGRTGVIAIKNSDFGDGFSDEVKKMAGRMHGDVDSRKRVISDIIKEGDLIELDNEDIIACSAIVSQNRRKTTVYFLGNSDMSTKFKLDVEIDHDGMPNTSEVKTEIVKIMRQKISPLLAR